MTLRALPRSLILATQLGSRGVCRSTLSAPRLPKDTLIGLPTSSNAPRALSVTTPRLLAAALAGPPMMMTAVSRTLPPSAPPRLGAVTALRSRRRRRTSLPPRNAPREKCSACPASPNGHPRCAPLLIGDARRLAVHASALRLCVFSLRVLRISFLTSASHLAPYSGGILPLPRAPVVNAFLSSASGNYWWTRYCDTGCSNWICALPWRRLWSHRQSRRGWGCVAYRCGSRTCGDAAGL